MRVFSIVVTYNALRNDWLHKCLDSLLCSELQTEIIVVDNASTDDTCTVIRDGYPSVILIKNTENKGFGAANNQGFEYGIKENADYFFLLNQDAWVDQSTVSMLINTSILYPEYGIIAPLHLNGSGDALDLNFSNFIVPKLCPNLYSDLVFKKTAHKTYELNFINAAAWLLPAKTLEVVGGFSPMFYHYGEDNNYCQRVLYHQLKICVFPATKIYHDRADRNTVPDGAKERERFKRLKYSNPFLTFNLKEDIKQLRKNLFKNKILNRKESVERDLVELRFLLDDAPQLEKFKNESKVKGAYKFLAI